MLTYEEKVKLRKRCKIANCTKWGRPGGLCASHGAETCDTIGCNNIIQPSSSSRGLRRCASCHASNKSLYGIRWYWYLNNVAHMTAKEWSNTYKGEELTIKADEAWNHMKHVSYTTIISTPKKKKPVQSTIQKPKKPVIKRKSVKKSEPDVTYIKRKRKDNDIYEYY